MGVHILFLNYKGGPNISKWEEETWRQQPRPKTYFNLSILVGGLHCTGASSCSLCVTEWRLLGLLLVGRSTLVHSDTAVVGGHNQSVWAIHSAHPIDENNWEKLMLDLYYSVLKQLSLAHNCLILLTGQVVRWRLCTDIPKDSASRFHNESSPAGSAV